VVTLHRPSNVDRQERLNALAEALVALQAKLPLVFPVHPRTAAQLAKSGLAGKLTAAGVKLVEPLPYKRFMSLVLGLRLVVTDSGGIQEETTYLGIPCLMLRPNTERPITISEGTNRLVTLAMLSGAVDDAMGRSYQPRRPEFCDGQTAGWWVADLIARG